MNKQIFIVSLIFLQACRFVYYGDTVKNATPEIEKTHVKRLDLSHSQLVELSSNLSKYKNLRYINLSNNPNLNLVNAFDILSSLSKLEVVMLDSNNLQYLPNNSSLLLNITHLSLVDNPRLNLDSLVESLQYSDKLKILNLSNNKIRTLPKIMFKLGNITNLRLSNNFINSEDNFIQLSKMNNLSLLWLDNNAIDILPRAVGKLHVKELYLDNNNINALPKEITSCNGLCVLYLIGNQFEELPLELIAMPKMMFLVISQNNIKYIPEAFKKSKYALAALIIDQNYLSEKEVEKSKKYFSDFFLLSFKHQKLR